MEFLSRIKGRAFRDCCRPRRKSSQLLPLELPANSLRRRLLQTHLLKVLLAERALLKDCRNQGDRWVLSDHVLACLAGVKLQQAHPHAGTAALPRPAASSDLLQLAPSHCRHLFTSLFLSQVVPGVTGGTFSRAALVSCSQLTPNRWHSPLAAALLQMLVVGAARLPVQLCPCSCAHAGAA